MSQTELALRIRKYSLLGILYLVGPVLVLTTDPSKLPLPLVVLPFLWLFAVLFVTTLMSLKKRTSVTHRKVVIIAGVVASIPVLLAIFQSIHQLSLRDVLLCLGLVFLAAWYVLRADFIR